MGSCCASLSIPEYGGPVLVTTGVPDSAAVVNDGIPGGAMVGGEREEAVSSSLRRAAAWTEPDVVVVVPSGRSH